MRIWTRDAAQGQAINQILGLQVPVEEGCAWEHDLSQEEMEGQGKYFINYYADLVLPAMDALKQAGVEKGDITVWLFYEYEEQCNMEFHPEHMALLLQMEATLCISCWQK